MDPREMTPSNQEDQKIVQKTGRDGEPEIRAVRLKFHTFTGSGVLSGGAIKTRFIYQESLSGKEGTRRFRKMAIDEFSSLNKIGAQPEGGLEGRQGLIFISQIKVEDAEVEVDFFVGRIQV